jgi:hypothetical protein
MSRSFYLGTDAQLAIGAANFSSIIATDFASLGLTSAQSTAYATLNTAWQASYLTAVTPETRTKSAVAAKNQQRELIRRMSSDLASIINGISTVSPEQKINLGLAVRGTPQPVTTLGTPHSGKVTLNANGSIVLGWKCVSPRASGMVYQIWRRIDDATAFTYMGGVGEKKYADSTIPAGTSAVTYQIQAVRSTAAGDFAQFNVNFGAGSSGMMAASVTQGKTTKVAA